MQQHSSQIINQAMILAAGRGERLRPLTDITPKPLLAVAGKKLIAYHIERLAHAGIHNIIINTAWLAEKIHTALGDGTDYGVSIRYSDEGEALETAGGIVRALPLLEERFIVVNADIWCDFDFSPWAQKPPAQNAHLVLVNNPAHHAAGDFALNDALLANNGEPRYTYSGIACFNKIFFAGLTDGKRALAPLLRAQAEHQMVSAELHRGRWIDVGTAERLQQLDDELSA